jgi:hypothetical protein
MIMVVAEIRFVNLFYSVTQTAKIGLRARRSSLN